MPWSSWTGLHTNLQKAAALCIHTFSMFLIRCLFRGSNPSWPSLSLCHCAERNPASLNIFWSLPPYVWRFKPNAVSLTVDQAVTGKLFLNVFMLHCILVVSRKEWNLIMTTFSQHVHSTPITGTIKRLLRSCYYN